MSHLRTILRCPGPHPPLRQPLSAPERGAWGVRVAVTAAVRLQMGREQAPPIDALTDPTPSDTPDLGFYRDEGLIPPRSKAEASGIAPGRAPTPRSAA